MYNWEHPGWPEFRFNYDLLLPKVERYESSLRQLMDQLIHLSSDDFGGYEVERLVDEAATTSSIEGEVISRQELLSSIRNNLNTTHGVAKNVRDLRARAVSQQIVHNRNTFEQPLSETTLKYWHQLLLNYDTTLAVVGDYRQGSGPMRIVSGPVYRQQVHFEAPPSNRVPAEMKRFIEFIRNRHEWINHPILKAGVSHIYFESIHPFEDGNGRIGRSILEKLLSQYLGSFIPFSISRAIESKRKEYYETLRVASTTLDIDPWMKYYCEALHTAVDYAHELVGSVLKQQRFFQAYGDRLDKENRKVLTKMFDEGPAGFRGGMTAKKYASINRVSRATATRALTRLTEIGALSRHGAGRGVHYKLTLK